MPSLRPQPDLHADSPRWRAGTGGSEKPGLGHGFWKQTAPAPAPPRVALASLCCLVFLVRSRKRMLAAILGLL